MVTRGPGATNAGAGVHSAFQDSTPRALVIGRVGQGLLDREADLERLTDEAAAARARFESERDSLKAARRRFGKALGREVDGLRKANRRRLDRAMAEFRKRPPGKRALARTAATLHGALDREAAGAVDRAHHMGGEAASKPRPKPSAGPREADVRLLVQGARVRHRSLGWVGRLLEVKGGRAAIVVRGKRIRVPIKDLRLAAEQAPAAGRVRVERSEPESVASELLLIGQLVEPALDSLDVYLDRALSAGREQVRVVHGHGTGRLRRAVREHLRGHPAVTSFRPAPASAGGNGATEVALR